MTSISRTGTGTRITKPVLSITAGLCLSMFAGMTSARVIEETPSAMAMTADLLIVRPFMLATTAVGSVVYLASLPFSLFGANADEAADTLVRQPAHNTFIRCLGCTQPGRQQEVLVTHKSASD